MTEYSLKQQALEEQSLPQSAQAAVDRVVAAHGAYIPVELLLASGHLRYGDYEAWRNGARPSLQPVLTDDLRQVVGLLKAAAGWAHALNLQPVVQDYFGWGHHAGQRLTFFEGGRCEANTLLATHYVRWDEPAVGDQLDLFLDSGVTVALQDFRASLRARAREDAQRCLTTLESRAPGHRLQPAARQLTDALAGLPNSIHAGQAADELATIEQKLSPAAREVLGSQARDLMAVFWQRLAAAVVDLPFDPECPKLHISYVCAQYLDWQRAINAIEAIRGYTIFPVLLRRFAWARYHNGQYNGAVAAWCLLCWCCAETAETALDNLPETATKLSRAWNDFRDLDLDPAPEAGLFPACLLLAEPGLMHSLPLDLAAGSGAGKDAFCAVRQMLQQDSIENRKAVSESAPWLLELYLE